MPSSRRPDFKDLDFIEYLEKDKGTISIAPKDGKIDVSTNKN
jgi:hypothetical protein